MRTALVSALPLLLLGTAAFWSRPLGLWSLEHARPWAPLFWAASGLALVVALLARRHGSAAPDAEAKTAAETHLPGSTGPTFGGSALRWLQRPAGLALAAVLSVLVFWLFRQRLFLPPPDGLGDSLDLARRLPVFTLLFGYLDSFDEILALYFRSKLYLLLLRFGWTAPEAGALWSCLWGGAYVAVVLYHLRRLSAGPFVFGVALFLGTPTVQLYCGYFENYAEATCILTALLLWSVRLLHRLESGATLESTSIAGLAALAALGAMFHMVVGAALPALALLVFLASKTRRKFIKTAGTATAAASAVIAPVWIYFVAVHPYPVSLREAHLANPPILPISKLFAAGHFWDLANLWLLCLPVVLSVAPLLLSGIHRGRRVRLDPDTGAARPAPNLDGGTLFCLAAAGAFLAWSFVQNPILGFPADWDLLSFITAPILVLAFERAAPWFHERHAPSNGWVPAPWIPLLIGLLLTTAWVARNATSRANSSASLIAADTTARNFVSDVQSDPTFLALPPDRRKQYARTVLFIRRAHRELAGLPADPTVRSLRSRLQVAERGYREVIPLPPGPFAERLPPVWRELTAVNVALEALIRSAGHGKSEGSGTDRPDAP